MGGAEAQSSPVAPLTCSRDAALPASAGGSVPLNAIALSAQGADEQRVVAMSRVDANGQRSALPLEPVAGVLRPIGLVPGDTLVIEVNRDCANPADNAVYTYLVTPEAPLPAKLEGVKVTVELAEAMLGNPPRPTRVVVPVLTLRPSEAIVPYLSILGVYGDRQDVVVETGHLYGRYSGGGAPYEPGEVLYIPQPGPGTSSACDSADDFFVGVPAGKYTFKAVGLFSPWVLPNVSSDWFTVDLRCPDDYDAPLDGGVRVVSEGKLTVDGGSSSDTSSSGGCSAASTTSSTWWWLAGLLLALGVASRRSRVEPRAPKINTR